MAHTDNGAMLKSMRMQLGMNATQLAEKLGVTPLTINRWERHTAVADKAPRERGRPGGVPKHVFHAMDWLLATHDRSFTVAPLSVSLALPRVLGSILPILAATPDVARTGDKPSTIAEACGLSLTIEDVETGMDALTRIVARHAQVAGAASGLMAGYERSVVDLGVVFQSSKAFVLLYRGSHAVRIGTDLNQFTGCRLLYPDGSDVGEILRKSDVGSVRNLECVGVTVDKAVEEFTRAASSKRAARLKKGQQKHTESDSRPEGGIVYVAWEPLITDLKERLEAAVPVSDDPAVQWRTVTLSADRFKGLTYEFHLFASRQWIADCPASAMRFMLCLAQASMQFDREGIRALETLWKRYDQARGRAHTGRRDNEYEVHWKSHDFTYQPSADALKLIDASRVRIVDPKNPFGLAKGEDA